MKKIFFLLSGTMLLLLACNKDKTKYNPGVTPAVVTTFPINVTAISAELTALLHTGGTGISNKGFYTLIVSPVMYDAQGKLKMKLVDSLVMATGVKTAAPAKGDFLAMISGLTSDTAYIVKAFASNDQGTTYGESVLFRSSKLVPPVAELSKAFINIGDSAAVITGSVTAVGGDVVTERGLVWGTTENPDLTNTKIMLGAGQGRFSDTLTSLKTFVKYFIRAYAINKYGTSYSEQLIVIFLPPTFTDPRDGEIYTIKQFGNAVWMTQNSRYIPGSGLGTDVWLQGFTGGDVVQAKKVAHYQDYGLLYTYERAVASAPAGWHLATDEEWKEVEMLTGLTRAEADGTSWRGGSNKKLKSNLWAGGATNPMGFNIHPGGKQWCGGAFQDFKSMSFYWTAVDTDEPAASSPYYRFFPPGDGTGRWNDWPTCVGLSVRYVRN